MRNAVTITAVLYLTSACGSPSMVPEATAQPEMSGSPLPDTAQPSSLSPDDESVSMGYSSPVRRRVLPSSLTCARKLLGTAGRTGRDADKLPALYQKHSRNKTEDFLRYMFAIIYVESRFNARAISEKQAYGLMQMTGIAVREARDHCNLKPLLSMDRMLDSVTNIRYGTCFLQKAVDELDGDWTRVLIFYNGGYRQLAKYDKGDSIVPETANYVLQVQRTLALCSETETGTTNSDGGI